MFRTASDLFSRLESVSASQGTDYQVHARLHPILHAIRRSGVSMDQGIKCIVVLIWVGVPA